MSSRSASQREFDGDQNHRPTRRSPLHVRPEFSACHRFLCSMIQPGVPARGFDFNAAGGAALIDQHAQYNQTLFAQFA